MKEITFEEALRAHRDGKKVEYIWKRPGDTNWHDWTLLTKSTMFNTDEWTNDQRVKFRLKPSGADPIIQEELNNASFSPDGGAYSVCKKSVNRVVSAIAEQIRSKKTYDKPIATAIEEEWLIQ